MAAVPIDIAVVIASEKSCTLEIDSDSKCGIDVFTASRKKIGHRDALEWMNIGSPTKPSEYTLHSVRLRAEDLLGPAFRTPDEVICWKGVEEDYAEQLMGELEERFPDGEENGWTYGHLIKLVTASDKRIIYVTSTKGRDGRLVSTSEILEKLVGAKDKTYFVGNVLVGDREIVDFTDEI